MKASHWWHKLSDSCLIGGNTLHDVIKGLDDWCQNLTHLLQAEARPYFCKINNWIWFNKSFNAEIRCDVPVARAIASILLVCMSKFKSQDNHQRCVLTFSFAEDPNTLLMLKSFYSFCYWLSQVFMLVFSIVMQFNLPDCNNGTRTACQIRANW